MLTIILILLLTYAAPTWEMTCYPEHPQTAYCRSHFVILGKLIFQENNTETDNLSQTIWLNKNSIPPSKNISVQIIQIYKGGNLLNATNQDIISIDIQNPWNHKFQERGNYLFTGLIIDKKPVIGMCSWCQRWEKLSLVQRLSMKRHYALNCHCRVKFCHIDDDCISDVDSFLQNYSCNWAVSTNEIGNEKTDCKAQASICMHSKSFNRCSWYTPKVKCVDSKEP